MDTIISNILVFETLIKKLQIDGKENLHVIIDFDGTITNGYVNGKEFPSIISILRDENYLTKDYQDKAKELFTKYHKIEIDPNISIQDKKEKMLEWWSRHFDLLIKSGLKKEDLEKVVETGSTVIRDGFLEFMELLNKNKIPIIIMSSSGLGGDTIAMYLKKYKCLYENVHIISNSFEWDSNGKIIGVKKPIIHSMNKDETQLVNFPFFENIENRKNLILIGNSLGDVGMSNGFKYKNLIKIGFFNDLSKENENYKLNLEKYKESFDFIILNDRDMTHIIKLFLEIIN